MDDTRPQDTEPQTADGKVLFHFAMSLDRAIDGASPYGGAWQGPVSS